MNFGANSQKFETEIRQRTVKKYELNFVVDILVDRFIMQCTINNNTGVSS
jgi:hypothetical protein